ncbi:nucleoid occlusion protein [Paraliobacillus quinghaiensis]|uniref:Nucleoid occlusion protein n=1 Tax=Paraliobacillus quinghaiensis TaxID=470815 RepID=A0A917TM53_9BACI|nr:nucleoid occlusion protein [Paraliobacillus quinghaiensis]GGM28598.1 nucleoid occlusion protein [Paraliobacillus quinghaiensis]
MLHPFSRIFGIGDKTEEGIEEYLPDEVLQIPINEIVANRYQPRAVFNQERIDELAQTIHTHGMIQPIVVRKLDDGEKKYELIAGERRWRAVTSLGWETVPAIIREMSDAETASVALIENLQREELTVIEEANAYGRLLEIHGLTQEALAQRLGKSQSTIANKMRLLKLPESVQMAIYEKKITERHARALIILKNPETQEKIVNEIIEKGLNVKQTEERIAKLMDNTPKKKKPKLKGVNKDMRIAMNTIRQSLNMVTDTGIDLETDEEDHDEYYQITIKIPKKK